MIDPFPLIAEHYQAGSLALKVLMTHSSCVKRKALEAAAAVSGLQPDTEFIAVAAMLHDIGMIRTHAPKIGCFGEDPYIRHGVIGRQMLEDAGLEGLAPVCERHTGVGLSVDDIERAKLPLPLRNMTPESLEERIICYADCFFSKDISKLDRERTPQQVMENIRRFGKSKVETFQKWHRLFSGE